MSPPSGVRPLAVTHSVLALGTIATTELSFADGSRASNQIEAVKTYATAGTYPVKLTVTDDQGLTCRDNIEVIAVAADGSLAPRFFSAAPTKASCRGPLLYQPIAAGTAPISWSLRAAAGSELPKGMTVDAATGAVAFSPDVTASKAEKAVLIATNAAGTAEQLLELEVDCAPQPKYGVGCACGSGPGTAAIWALLLLALGFQQRRRLSAPAR